jgi:AcrR family transcriptional regulator
MKRKEQKENTRARVLEAAKHCIANRDVREVSMQEIALRAKLSVGALYVHFESRDALIDGLIDELQDALIAQLKTALLAIEKPSTPAAIRRLATSFVEAFDDLRPFVALYASHVARSTSTEALRGSGAAAPLVQMVNATLGSLPSKATSTDRPLLAAALVSLWRAAALSQTARPASDAVVIASSLASLTLALVESACPALLTMDARLLARGMAQFLK